MIVQDIMVRNVIVTSPDTTIKDALKKMNSKRIRHLPVVNNKMEVIGLVSDRDLKAASPSIYECENPEILEMPLKDVMVSDVLTALPFDFVEEAANIMTENHISCLPVEEDGKLIGIITETDLLHTLVKLTGADMPSSRLEIEVPNQSGMLSCISCIIKDHQLNIHSSLVYPSNNPEKKILVFRIQAMDIRKITNAIKEAGYTVLWPTDLELKL